MADPHNTTKGEDVFADSDENLEGTLSLEELDATIAKADPEFAASLKKISNLQSNKIIYEENLKLDFQIEDELKIWNQGGKFKKIIAKIFPFLPRWTYSLKIKRTIFRLNIKKWKIEFVEGVKHAPQNTVKGLKNGLSSFKESLGNGLVAFKAYSLSRKLVFVGLVFLTTFVIGLLFKIATKGLLPPEEKMFISSMSEWAHPRYLYDPAGPWESFYESTRTSQNVLLMRKLIANIKTSPNSGSNPMGAFEFYVEGTVAEVVIEIKDREPEIEDLFLRIIEEISFDQISSPEGKRQLCDKLKKEVNKILTKGFVRRIFIKNAIVKP